MLVCGDGDINLHDFITRKFGTLLAQGKAFSSTFETSETDVRGLRADACYYWLCTMRTSVVEICLNPTLFKAVHDNV